MCLALKGSILEVDGNKALVDFGGVKRKVNSELFKVKKGDKVLVFNDIVIERL